MGMYTLIPSNATNPIGTNPNYQSISTNNSSSYDSPEVNVQTPVAVSGTFDYFRVKCQSAPGTGTTVTWTLRVNGVDTALTVTISGTNKTGTDTTHSVTVNAGDLVNWKITYTGSPSSLTTVSSTCRFLSNTSGTGVLFAKAIAPSAGTTGYAYVQGNCLANSTETNREAVMPTPGTISKLSIFLDVAPGGSDTISVTLMKNGSTTALTTTLSASSTTGTDSSDTVTYAQGDTLSYKIVSSATAATGYVGIGVQWVPTTDGESLGLDTYTATLAQASTRYKEPIGGRGNYQSTETSAQLLTMGCTVNKLYVFSAGIASGQTLAMTLRKNSAGTTLTSTITGTATSASDTTHNVTVADDDLLSLQYVTSATTGTITQTMAAVVYFLASPIASILYPPTYRILQAVSRAANY